MDFNKNSKDVISKELGVKRFLKSVASAVAVMFLSVWYTSALDDNYELNRKEHFVYDSSQHRISLPDEGFRWRDSLNFKLDGKDLTGWYLDGQEINSANQVHLRLCNLIDRLHQHLSKEQEAINKTATGQNRPRGINHLAAAAVTIVVEPEGQQKESLVAYSTIVKEPTKYKGKWPDCPAVAIPATIMDASMCDRVLNAGNKVGSPVSLCYTIYKLPQIPPKANITETIVSHAKDVCKKLSGGKAQIASYGCAEGIMITRLLENEGTVPKFGSCYTGDRQVSVQHRPLLISCLKALLSKASATYGKFKVKLVVLHIHSRCDPCAKCAKVFAGISEAINNNSKFFNNVGLNYQIPFFIEVSSRESYGIPKINVSNEKYCSCAELAGHDGNENAEINVQTVGQADMQLPVFLGQFTLKQNSFPPYIAFTRISVEGTTKSPTGDNCEYKTTHSLLNPSQQSIPSIAGGVQVREREGQKKTKNKRGRK